MQIIQFLVSLDAFFFFKPDIKKLCAKLNMDESDCELKDNWNQASFAAFLTYEEEQDFLTDLKNGTFKRT